MRLDVSTLLLECPERLYQRGRGPPDHLAATHVLSARDDVQRLNKVVIELHENLLARHMLYLYHIEYHMVKRTRQACEFRFD